MKTSATLGSRLGRLGSNVLVWFYAALLLVPLYFLVISPFKTNEQIFNAPFLPPTSFDPSNLINAWQGAQLGPGLLNSAVVTAGAEVLTLALALPAAFCIARFATRLSAFIERLFLLGFLIPGFAALVPTVLLAVHLDLLYTQQILIFYLAATALPLSIIVLSAFLRTIPRELEEAARIDGAGWFTLLFRVYLPMSTPGIVTVILLNFLAFWNEYIFSLVLLGPDPSVRTVQLAIPDLGAHLSTQYGLVLAGVLIAFIPPMILFLVLQRQMRSALLEGAVKG